MHRAAAITFMLALHGVPIACGRAPEPQAEPTPDAPASAAPAAPAAPTTVDPGSPEPEPSRPSTPPTEPTAAAEPTPAALHLVAVREGAFELLPYHGAPFVVLEGEPIPWVEGRFDPESGSARGLPPLRDPLVMMTITEAIGGGPQDPRPTFVTTERYNNRTSSVHEVHQRRSGRWRRVDLRKPPLSARYSTYVEREGALLGLRTWGFDDVLEEEEPMDDEEYAQREAQYEVNLRLLQRSRPSWVQLSGDPIALPELPAKAMLVDATSTPDGTLFAIDSPREEDATRRLLMWPPGLTKAEAIALPGLERAWGVELSTSGDFALAFGSLERDDWPTESYLAVGRGRAWERIPVELPSRGPDGTVNLVGAARTPTGELWIALGFSDIEPETFDEQPVWRRPVGGTWEPVALPEPPDDPFGPRKDWIFDRILDWTEIERSPPRMSPAKAWGLTWVAGAVWVTLELGTSPDGHSPQTAVLASRPATGGPQVLPPAWSTELQRYNADIAKAEPGSDGCEVFSMVLGPATLARERPELPDALEALELKTESDTFGAIYVGRLGPNDRRGKKQLVVLTFAVGAERVTAVREAVQTATGLSPTLDCRIARLETMVRAHPHPD